MKRNELELRLLLAAGASALAMAGASAYAQDSDVDLIEEDEQNDARGVTDPAEDTIVVTGSRLRRSEYDAVKPLRVFDTQDAKAEGLFSASDILQNSSIAGGVQFDATFTGVVTDSGPGASTINLRGLGADRTLVLLNGRRLAPAGVQGAPTRPDLNLLPAGIIDQYDVLLDGASSIYGSDAVAGVVNAIIRNDFEGVELNANFTKPEFGGGEEKQLVFTAGTASDRGNLLFGAEYVQRDVLKRGDRDFTPCTRDIEINPATGERRTLCQQNSFGNMVLDPLNALFGSDVFGDGTGPDFYQFYVDFDNGGFFNVPVNNAAGGPGDEVVNLANPDETVFGIGSRFVFDNERNGNRFSDEYDLAQGIELFKAYAGGEYAITDTVDTYFEMLYSNRNQEINLGGQQIFPSVPCDNPFVQREPTLANAPVCQVLAGGPFDDFAQLVFLPFVEAQGNETIVEVAQFRGVLGFKGDFGDILPSYESEGDFGLSFGNWSWDIWGSYDRSNGNTSSFVINQDRLSYALNNVSVDGDGNIVCDGLEGDLFGFISSPDCVPLDVTDVNIYRTGQLPEDFLNYAGGNTTNRTLITQSMVNGSVTGDLFKLPDGVVPLALGFEYREDRIESYNDYLLTAAAAVNLGREGNTFGTTDLMEVFIETEFPIFRGRSFAEELTIGASARWTEERNFGALWTYGFTANYLPVDWLRLRGTFGTTYKAPNLRQQFLAGQISFAGAFIDPCVASTFNNLTAEEQAIARPICVSQGANPDQLGIGGATSIPVLGGGNGQTLDAETSEGYTLGIAIEQPWFDSFDLRASATYYAYDIEDSIVAPSAGFVLFDCIVEGNPTYCDRISRLDTGDTSRNFIDEVDASFLNVGEELAEGLDFSVNFDKEFTVNDKPLDLSLSARMNHTTVREQTILGDFIDFKGDFGNPEWRGDFRGSVGYDDFTLVWATDFIGAVSDQDDIDPVRTADNVIYDFASCSVVTTDPVSGAYTGVDPSSCSGVYLAEGFRDKEEAGEYFLHRVSLNYQADTWSATAGIRNVFNRKPPLVDDGEVASTLANVPLGRGYDVYGRSFFLSLTKTF